MHFFQYSGGREPAIVELFRSTFSDSEGAEEGERIARLVQEQLTTTPAQDRWLFIAEDGDAVVGACMFTRLRFDSDARTVYLLSPMAVTTTRQAQGIGQQLINHGLDKLRAEGVDAVLTYGDPNYYHRVGFDPIDEALAAAPLPLQYPEGWLGQSLTKQTLLPLQGQSRCVQALNDPALW
jgi:putative acetyltransferase